MLKGNKMQKLFIDYELQDGTSGSARILAADKIRFETAARANSWPIEDGPRAMSIMLFASLKRTHTIDCTYEEFIADHLADFALNRDSENDDENPTR